MNILKKSKKLFAILMCLAMVCAMASCVAEKTQSTEESDEDVVYDSQLNPPETDVVKMARVPSGHVLNIIAEKEGYLEEEGIRVEYVDAETDDEVFDKIDKGLIDIASSSGTNLPLERIAEGQDLTIFAGYDVTGCLPIFARAETPWNGIEDLIGRKVAFEPNFYPVTGTLLDLGHDPVNDIQWFNPESQEERIRAVKEGRVDFGLVGTNLYYKVVNDPELKICTYAADVMPAYSCCRVEASTEWVNNNPGTVKALLRAWIRALDYYDDHHDEAVAMVAEESGLDEADIRVQMDNPRRDLNIDPLKSSVIRAWNYLDKLGLLDYRAKQMDINDHINIDLYKQALDECQAKYGSENQDFYEDQQALYAKRNLNNLE